MGKAAMPTNGGTAAVRAVAEKYLCRGAAESYHLPTEEDLQEKLKEGAVMRSAHRTLPLAVVVFTAVAALAVIP